MSKAIKYISAVLFFSLSYSTSFAEECNVTVGHANHFWESEIKRYTHYNGMRGGEQRDINTPSGIRKAKHMRRVWNRRSDLHIIVYYWAGNNEIDESSVRRGEAKSISGDLVRIECLS